jgi:hypothetical protein
MGNGEKEMVDLFGVRSSFISLRLCLILSLSLGPVLLTYCCSQQHVKAKTQQGVAERNEF